MKKSYFAAALILLLGLPLQSMAAEDSYEAEGVYHGTAVNGMTGLYYTTSPYTVGTGISAAAYVEMASTTTTTTLVTPATVTIGLGNVEFSAATRLYSDSASSVSATGDTEVYAKWKFRSLGESMPAMALAIGGTLPTATNAAARDVNQVGYKLMFIAGGDVQASTDTVIGTYFNLVYNAIDPGQATDEKYLTANFGLMMPISDNNKLQMFIDTRNNTAKSAATIGDGTPGTTLMIGFRYTGRFLKILAGVNTNSTGNKLISGLSFEI